jgi:phage/plasmid-like protein (TIGR03299 family)
MSHMVQTMFSVGATWHSAPGSVVVTEAVSAEEALALAKITWTVNKGQACTSDGRPIPGNFYTYREDTGGFLGNVGRVYHPIQNKALFSFFDHVIDPDKGIFYHSAGALCGGKVVWILAKVPGDLFITPNDSWQNYTLIGVSHDGTLPLFAKHTPIRVVCNNTLNMAIDGWKDTVRIRHTAKAEEQLQEAHKALGLATRIEAVREQALSLMDIALTQPMVAGLFKQLFAPNKPVTDYEAQEQTRSWETFQSLLESPTQNVDTMYGSGYWFYNAVAEYADWNMPAHRGTDTTHRAWFGSGAALKKATAAAILSLK